MFAIKVHGGTGAGRKRPLKGPPEEWFCECRDHRGHAILRRGYLVRCTDCHAERP